MTSSIRLKISHVVETWHSLVYYRIFLWNQQRNGLLQLLKVEVPRVKNIVVVDDQLHFNKMQSFAENSNFSLRFDFKQTRFYSQ